jgi:putative ABC transport system ATP-binding protein
MKELNRTERTTFIFSTHDAKVMSNATTVVRLADGKLVDRLTGAEAVAATLSRPATVVGVTSGAT